jgi:hypothetical protein
VIQSAEWGNPLWDQSVQCFNSAADRTAQYPAPHTGSLSWLEDIKQLQLWNGAAWTSVADTYGGTEQAWVGANPPKGTLRQMKRSWGFYTVNAFGAITVTLTPYQGITWAEVHPANNEGNFAYAVVLVGSSSTSLLGAYCYTNTGALVANGAAIRAMISIEGW